MKNLNFTYEHLKGINRSKVKISRTHSTVLLCLYHTHIAIDSVQYFFCRAFLIRCLTTGIVPNGELFMRKKHESRKKLNRKRRENKFN